jgi:hypothetical protein
MVSMVAAPVWTYNSSSPTALRYSGLGAVAMAKEMVRSLLPNSVRRPVTASTSRCCSDFRSWVRKCLGSSG